VPSAPPVSGRSADGAWQRRFDKALFERYDVNAFPVVDERGVLRGMVSRLEALRVFRPDRRRWISGLLALWAERVDEIMSRGTSGAERRVQAMNQGVGYPVWAVPTMHSTWERLLPLTEPMGTGNRRHQ
jgi:hypothetical protein